eukprot:s4261_g8.t1
MIWLGAGAGRDCFKLENHALIVKWFSEVDSDAYKQLHPNELAGWRSYAEKPVGAHLPVVFGHQIQAVYDNSNQTMTVDCLLMEYVGDTLGTVLQILNQNWTLTAQATLKRMFVEMLFMCHQAHASDLLWNGDFHSGNICYHPERKRWYLIDLESFECCSHGFSTETHKAAKRQQKDVNSHETAPHRLWSKMLQDHMMDKGGWAISVREVAKLLAVDFAAVEAFPFPLNFSCCFVLSLAELCPFCHVARQQAMGEPAVSLTPDVPMQQSEASTLGGDAQMSEQAAGSQRRSDAEASTLGGDAQMSEQAQSGRSPRAAAWAQLSGVEARPSGAEQRLLDRNEGLMQRSFGQTVAGAGEAMLVLFSLVERTAMSCAEDQAKKRPLQPDLEDWLTLIPTMSSSVCFLFGNYGRRIRVRLQNKPLS